MQGTAMGTVQGGEECSAGDPFLPPFLQDGVAGAACSGSLLYVLKVPAYIPPCLSLAGGLFLAQTVTCTWGALAACRLITTPLLPGLHLEMVDERWQRRGNTG